MAVGVAGVAAIVQPFIASASTRRMLTDRILEGRRRSSITGGKPI
jgi:hypothetical protein